jgi:hypothetical protein
MQYLMGMRDEDASGNAAVEEEQHGENVCCTPSLDNFDRVENMHRR